MRDTQERHSTPAAPMHSHASAWSPSTRTPPALSVTWASCERDVRAAQRLRHQVFCDEMGARPVLPAGTPAGHEVDVFDPYCEHLIVRAGIEDVDSLVVGTYRVMTAENARRIGGFYGDTEFDLTRLRRLRPRMLELGRSCVHPDWRHGGVILALWSALVDFAHRQAVEAIFGCVSIGMRDGGHTAASLWRQLEQHALAPIECRVTPRLPLPVDDLQHDLNVEAPPLVKGYLRCGAKVLGPPAWDPDFNTADLPMLVRLNDLPPRLRRRAAAI